MPSSMTRGVVTAGVMVLGLVAGRVRLVDGKDGLLPITAPTQSLTARLRLRGSSTA